MAASLMRLPPELRIPIYGKLLIDTGFFEPEQEGKNLYPAILRTSKQIYTETSAVLYGENVFRFYYSQSALRCEDRLLSERTFLSVRIFAMIEHLELFFGMSEIRHLPANTIGAALESITESDCHLKAFRITINLREGTGTELSLFDKAQNEILSNLVQKSSLPQAISRVKVQTEIKISIRSPRKTGFKAIERLASVVADSKTWTVVT